MKIYKFKDTVDNNFCFILAKTETDAIEEIKKHTSLPFTLIESKNITEINKPIIIYNKIVPF